MSAEDTLNQVKRMVQSYQSHRHLYLHRQIMIVHCTEWAIGEEYVYTNVTLERVVVGDSPNSTTWQFGVRWDDICPNNLAIDRLSGCQLRDTIVFDSDLLQQAESVDSTNEKSVAALRSRLYGL